MADHDDRDTSARQANATPPRVPRWVKVGAVVAGVIVALLLALQFTGVAGDHGPGRHDPSDHQPGEHASQS